MLAVPVTEVSLPSAEVNSCESCADPNVPQPCLPQPVATASYRLV
jgi:hypothetical protein